MKYPLAVSTWDKKEIEAIHRVIESDQYTMGKYVKEFEENFAQFLKSKYCVMVNSGSSANLLMIAALFFSKEPHLQRGDEILVPAVSWPTTYYPLSQYGLILRFVDVDLNTLNYNLADLEAAVTSNTRAIMVVNLLGNPNHFDRINEIAKKHNLFIIEDNCESLGATYNGRQAGTFGLMGSYSSFFSHHISTMEGGIITTDNEELYQILLCLRAHGWSRNLPKYNHVCGEKLDDPFIESYRFLLPGYNLRPLEMSGAIGIEQLKKLPDFVQKRRENAAHFKHIFENNPYFIIQEEIGESSWFAFSLILMKNSNAPFTREVLTKKMMDAGIECRPIVTGNFVKNEVLKFIPHSIYGDLKNAEWIDKNGIYIGNHPFNLAENINYLANILS